MRERLTKAGVVVKSSSPEEFGKMMEGELDRWETVRQKAGLEKTVASLRGIAVACPHSRRMNRKRGCRHSARNDSRRRFAIVLPPSAAANRGASSIGEKRTMPRWSAIAAAALVAALAALTASHPTSAQSGWTALFDGKSLDNFSPLGDANWRIEDGVLVADKASKISYLVSKQDYGDFQIRAEFWVSDDANSGIFIRCTDPTEVGSKTAYEVNIFDTRPDPSYGTGAIVDVAKVTTPIKAGGKWNMFEITAKGSHVRRDAQRREDRGRRHRRQIPQGPHRAAVRPGRGEVPQGRDQADVRRPVARAIAHARAKRRGNLSRCACMPSGDCDALRPP